MPAHDPSAFAVTGPVAFLMPHATFPTKAVTALVFTVLTSAKYSSTSTCAHAIHSGVFQEKKRLE